MNFMTDSFISVDLVLFLFTTLDKLISSASYTDKVNKLIRLNVSFPYYYTPLPFEAVSSYECVFSPKI